MDTTTDRKSRYKTVGDEERLRRSGGAAIDDEMFDDACDLGQFFLNPAYYVFTRVKHAIQGLKQDQKNIMTVQSTDTKRSNVLHLQLPMYVFFLVSGWTSVFIKVYPIARASHDVSSVHINVGYAVFIACIVSWRYASTTSPGFITVDNLWKYDNYKYDNVLYVQETAQQEETSKSTSLLRATSEMTSETTEAGRVTGGTYVPSTVTKVVTATATATTTANGATGANEYRRKVARSKYDRYSKKTVARFDHYCGWLRQPIGEENYRFFLAFVGVHACMCLYGTFILAILVTERRQPRQQQEEVDDNDAHIDTATVDDSTSPTTNSHYGIVGMMLHDKSLTLIGLFLFSATVPLIGFFCFHLYLVCAGMTTNEYYKWKVIQSRHDAARERYDRHMMPTALMSNNSTSKNSSIVCSIGGNSCSIDEEGGENVSDPGQMPSNIYDLGLTRNILEVLFPRSLQKGLEKYD